MCRVWLLVIKRHGATISTEKPSLFSCHCLFCVFVVVDRMIIQRNGMWVLSRLFVEAYQMTCADCKTWFIGTVKVPRNDKLSCTVSLKISYILGGKINILVELHKC